MSDEDHWSSPNGCHEDCPACAAEQEKELRVQRAVQKAWSEHVEGSNGPITDETIRHIAGRAVGAIPEDERGEDAYESALAEAKSLAEIATNAPTPLHLRPENLDVGPLVRHLEEEGFKPEHLDEAVHDAASERATAANNDGLEAQVLFLLRGSDNSWKPGDIIAAARRAKEEDEDG